MSKIQFTRKKSSVLVDLRPMYKISLILLILKINCIGGKSSLLKLHLFNWALLDNKRIKMLRLSADENDIKLGFWGIDPSLNMALNYSISEKLVTKMPNGSYKITNHGSDFISNSDLINLFDEASTELNSISKKITEKMIADSTKRWMNEI